jgi:hypothetical protein
VELCGNTSMVVEESEKIVGVAANNERTNTISIETFNIFRKFNLEYFMACPFSLRVAKIMGEKDI